ncbi:hypothetical protein MMC11_002606 [Xylographa trunciseda]|nr:hypothetical protein [Xylographa trunciseda]
MAEIGLIASVIGVAGAGLKLALTLRQFASEVKDAARQMHDIATSVSLFSTTLREVGKSVQSRDSPRSNEALEALMEITNNCRSVFEEIESMIQVLRPSEDVHMPQGRRSTNIKPSVQWVFKKSKVQYLTGRLESSKLTLVIMLQTFHYRTTMEESLQTRDKIKASEQSTKEDIEEAMRETKGEIESLRAEIRNLILDRFWVDQNLAATAHEAALDDPEESVYNEPTATFERAVHGENSKALVLLKTSSLTSLDASLAGADTDRDNVSQRTVLRSITAVDYLLDLWTVSTDLRGSGKYREDISSDSDDDLFGRGTLHTPQGSFPKSRANLKATEQGFAIMRTPKDGASTSMNGDIRDQRSETQIAHEPSLNQSPIQLRLLKLKWTLNPSTGYKFRNKEITWAINREKYLEICLAGSERFLWGVDDGDSDMRFIGAFFIGAVTSSLPRNKAPYTYLPCHTFSRDALLNQRVGPIRGAWRNSPSDLRNSPLQEQRTLQWYHRVPRSLGIREIRELRRLSLELDSMLSHFHERNAMTITEHVDHLRSLQILESLGR